MQPGSDQRLLLHNWLTLIPPQQRQFRSLWPIVRSVVFAGRWLPPAGSIGWGWQGALIRNMRYSTHRRPIDLDRTQDLRAEGRMRRATVDRSTGSGPGQRRDSAGSSRYCLRCVPRQVDILAAACGDARA